MATHSHEHARCHEILSQLNAYADGELDDLLCRDLEQHLSGCPDCRIVLDTLTKTIALYHTLREEAVALPPEVEERLLRQLKLVPS